MVLDSAVKSSCGSYLDIAITRPCSATSNDLRATRHGKGYDKHGVLGDKSAASSYSEMFIGSLIPMSLVSAC